MRQGLAGGSPVGRGTAGGGELGQLGVGLCGFSHDVLSYWAWRCQIASASISRRVKDGKGGRVKHTIGDGVVGSCSIWTDIVSQLGGGLREDRAGQGRGSSGSVSCVSWNGSKTAGCGTLAPTDVSRGKDSNDNKKKQTVRGENEPHWL